MMRIALLVVVCVSIAESCKDDANEHCDTYLKRGYCHDTSPFFWYMQVNCQFTCKLCDTRPLVSPDCKDQDGVNCFDYKQRNYCKFQSSYLWYMKLNCQRTCGFCMKYAQTTTTTTTTITPPPAVVSCEDKINCARYPRIGYCDQTNEFHWYMKMNCKKTCGICGTNARRTTTTTTTTTTTRRPTTSFDLSCVDISKECAPYKGRGYCEEGNGYLWYMSKNCKRTCDFCTPELTTSPPTIAPRRGNCKDADASSRCATYQRRDFCHHTSQHYNYMKRNCQATCNLCPTTAPALVKDCKDAYNMRGQCESWKKGGLCQSPKHQRFMTNNCLKTCQLC